MFVMLMGKQKLIPRIGSISELQTPKERIKRKQPTGYPGLNVPFPADYSAATNPEQFDRNYYKYVMQCCYMCRIFYSLGQGVSNLGRWRLQTSAFNDFKVPVPPYEEQVTIGKYLDNVISETNMLISQKQEQLSILTDYKKSIIYEYVTGKKEVPAS